MALLLRFRSLPPPLPSSISATDAPHSQRPPSSHDSWCFLLAKRLLLLPLTTVASIIYSATPSAKKSLNRTKSLHRPLSSPTTTLYRSENGLISSTHCQHLFHPSLTSLQIRGQSSAHAGAKPFTTRCCGPPARPCYCGCLPQQPLPLSVGHLCSSLPLPPATILFLLYYQSQPLSSIVATIARSLIQPPSSYPALSSAAIAAPHYRRLLPCRCCFLLQCTALLCHSIATASPANAYAPSPTPAVMSGYFLLGLTPSAKPSR
ncbi:hypothetical protein B296_00001502 [Ensete ventricosum]|uniref:Uncharacterized protein n=1 Tax=Ensete ventricosum TaxID=4639 RepID=A0A426ZTD7_ENSVE|nr:hypothetical protein B296_00001502 [Ensete ventricosum]